MSAEISKAAETVRQITEHTQMVYGNINQIINENSELLPYHLLVPLIENTTTDLEKIIIELKGLAELLEENKEGK